MGKITIVNPKYLSFRTRRLLHRSRHDSAQNLIHQPDALAASPGFRLFSEKSLAPDLPPLRIMNYAFGLTLRGTATETIGLQTYAIRPYTVVFTFPGQIVSYTDTSPDLSFRYCVFDDAFMNSPHLNQRLIDGFGFFRAEGRPVFHLSPETGRAVHGLLEKVQAECAARRPDTNGSCGSTCSKDSS
jgi:hypothetical protein